MKRSTPKSTTQNKRNKVRLCCVSSRKSTSKELIKNKSNNNAQLQSILLLKKKVFHILTSIGSDLEVYFPKNVKESKLDNNEDIGMIDFPPCCDLPGYFKEQSEVSCLSDVKLTPLFTKETKEIKKVNNPNIKVNDLYLCDPIHGQLKAQIEEPMRNSGTFSDLSSITLKDILENYDTSSTGSPTFTDQSIPSFEFRTPTKKKFNHSQIPDQNRSESCNVRFSPRSGQIEQNLTQYFSKDKNLKYSEGNNVIQTNGEPIYDNVESITFQPYGSVVTSILSSSSLCLPSKNENNLHALKDPNDRNNVAQQMPSLSRPYSACQQIQSPSIINLPDNIPRTFLRQHTKSYNDEIYQDIDKDFSDNPMNSSHFGHIQQSSKAFMKHPPSTLCQKINKSKLRLSFSGEISQFSHLLTKKSGSDVSLTKIMNYKELRMNVEPSFYRYPELRYEF